MNFPLFLYLCALELTTKKNTIMSITKYISNPSLSLVSLLKRCSYFIQDRLFVRLEYRLKLKSWPDLDNPTTLSEKIQWLKLYDRHPDYTQMVDKIEAKKYAARLIGSQHIIPTIAVWDRVKDIDFDALPDQYVLKSNHRGGGMVFICKDKASFNKRRAKRKLKHQLLKDMYCDTKEWPYKYVNRRILCEEYMVDESGDELKDYKFYCFNGKPEFCQLVSSRYKDEDTRKDVYDSSWTRQEFSGPLDFNDRPKGYSEPIAKPENLELMLDIARKLSSGLKFVRIDLYNINGQVYFGEITFYPASGMRTFYPHKWNEILGDKLSLE